MKNEKKKHRRKEKRKVQRKTDIQIYKRPKYIEKIQKANAPRFLSKN